MAKNALKASKSRSDVILRSNSASESLMCFQSAAFDKFRFKVDFNNMTKKKSIFGVLIFLQEFFPHTNPIQSLGSIISQIANLQTTK